MAFATCFDGFAVIHASFIHPQRRPHFECELKRVGIHDFSVIETSPVSDDDGRLRNYRGPNGEENLSFNAKGHLSLTDGFLSCINLAESRRWKSVVIMEDDIVFRRDFSRLWRPIEAELSTVDWGVLTLHRVPEGKFIVREPIFGTTRLIPIQYNLMNHCVIVRSTFYRAFAESLQTCIERGYPGDFFYGIFLYWYPNSLFATNRNLAGQCGSMASSLRVGIRKNNHYSVFRSGNPLECAVMNSLHAGIKRMRDWL
jgi:hypothetical protein